MEHLNTVAMLLLYSLILSLHILRTNCDRTCDCQEIDVLKDMMQKEVLERNLLKEFVQKEVLEQKMESLRLHDKIRRIKATQRSIPTSAETTHIGFAYRIKKIETDVANVKLNMLLNEQSERHSYAEVVKKGLMSEKRKRREFISEMENQIAEMKGTVDTFKSELIGSNEQYIANITSTNEYFRHDIDAKLDETERKADLKFTSVTADLNNIEQNLLEGKTNVAALNNMIMKDKIDGGWSHWGTWSSCSVSCGNGIRDRKRTCTNPRPSLLGKQCEGSSVMVGSCGNMRCTAVMSAFSVSHPNKYSEIHGTMRPTFSHEIYQLGGDFNPPTGMYICSVPGTYHFSVTLVKKRANTRVDYVNCHFYKSGSVIIYIGVDPTDDNTDKGNAAISQSVVIHLNKGDTVYLGDCSNPSTSMENWSSFTGFLLYPDN